MEFIYYEIFNSTYINDSNTAILYMVDNKVDWQIYSKKIIKLGEERNKIYNYVPIMYIMLTCIYFIMLTYI